MSANLTVYCLNNLTDYAEFERLCNDLMLLQGYLSIEPLGGFKDKGRDAIHVSKSQEITIFAYSVREDWKDKLMEDAEKIYKHGHVCHELIFITTSQPTATERDKAINDVRSKYGWNLEVYGLERLRMLLDTSYPETKNKYPQIFPPNFFANQTSLMGKVLEAFNREMLMLKENLGHPNGIALSKLACMAVEQEGDFNAAIEAIALLFRLAYAVNEKRFLGMSFEEEEEDVILRGLLVVKPITKGLQRANVISSTIKALKCFIENDYSLLKRANEWSRMFALVGESLLFSKLSDYSQIPHKSFGTVATIWNATCLEFYSEGMESEAKEMTRLLVNTLVGLAFAVYSKGVVFPEPPKVLYYSACGERLLEPGHHVDLLPIISLLNTIATLPIELFIYAFESLQHSTGIASPQEASEGIIELSDALEAIKRWAVVPGPAIVCGVFLKTQQDIETFNRELQVVHERGMQVSLWLAEFLMVERALALRENFWGGLEPEQVINRLRRPGRTS
ncbi:hypothetical protein NDI45_18650 [Leptolyngbya sp. GB1-A1]|uniref:hypothetical protein n=1 Tax=Leptolyngbya sp. GB1-A1 TaxID=2933908 RepID=UPI00329A461C